MVDPEAFREVSVPHVSRRPERVQVGPFSYHVELHPGLAEASGAAGACGSETLNFLLDSQLAPDVERETLLHEIIHGIVNQTLLVEILSDKQQEHVCRGLAPLVLDTLRRNPELVAWLLQSGT